MYGDNPQQSPDFARMISEHDAARVASYIIPEKVVLGGRYDIKDRYVEPTILYPSTWEDPALQQEILGLSCQYWFILTLKKLLIS